MSNGKILTDADKAFIAKIKKQLQDESGKVISDTDKKKYERLIWIKSQGQQWQSSLADELKKLDRLPEQIKESLDQVKKKYARGGGVRKVRYK